MQLELGLICDSTARVTPLEAVKLASEVSLGPDEEFF